MRNGLTGCEALCGLAELLSLNRAVYPAVQDLNDNRSGLQALGPYGPDGIGDDVCAAICHDYQ